MAHAVNQGKGEADIVFVGDSVGRQIIRRASRVWRGSGSGQSLATNQVVEMAGHYFFVRRYLLRCKKKPRAVIFVGGSQEGVNLDQYAKENYLQRVFLRWDEIEQLTFSKGLRFGLVMAVHKLFPSYRYRNHIQKKALGFSNASIATGLTKEAQAAGIAKGGPETYEVAGTLYETYTRRLLDMLDREDIDFYYIFPPVSRKNWGLFKGRYESIQPFLMSLRREYRNFRFLGELRVAPDNNFISDGYHLRDGTAGMDGSIRYVLDCVGRALKNTKKEAAPVF